MEAQRSEKRIAGALSARCTKEFVIGRESAETIARINANAIGEQSIGLEWNGI